MKTSIIWENGKQKIKIDNKVFETLSFRSFRPEKRNISEFYDAGVRLMSVLSTGQDCTLAVPYSLFGEMWKGIKEYDFSVLDRQMELFITNAPEAYFNIMLQIDTKDWYLEQHPECSNTFLNLCEMAAYPKWRADTSVFLTDAINYIEEKYGEKVFSYSLFCGGSTEWYTNSQTYNNPEGEIRYHPLKEQAFREWIGNPQAELPEMAELSRTENGIFRHPVKNKEALDYWNYHHKIIGETICYYAGVAKKAMGNNKLIAVYYGYLTQLMGARFLYEGQLGYESVWDCPDLDMILAPAKYQEPRSFTGVSGFLHTVDSLKLKNKLSYHEIDHTTYIAPEKVESGRGIPGSDKKFKNEFETRMVLRREFALCEAKRVSMWWFDFFGGYYYADELMEEVENIVRVKNQLADVEMKSVSEIAVFADIDSMFNLYEFSGLSKDLNVSIPDELGRIGAPYDIYTFGDIDDPKLDLSQYKLFIFLNTYVISEEKRAFIDKNIKCNGNTILWYYAPGYIDEKDFSLDRMAEVTGMNIQIKESNESLVKYADLSFGFSEKIGPLFYIDDDDVTAVAEYQETKEPAIGYKKDNDFTVYYSAVGNTPYQLLREIATSAGIHIYYEGKDPVYVNNAVFGIHAVAGGEYTFNFPKECQLLELFEGGEFVSVNKKITCSLEKGKMYLFRINN